jgi:hypothetical protein
MSDPYNYPGTNFKDSPTEYGGNFQYRVGLNHVGAYQVSGIPFVTSSNATVINFPYVTKTITVENGQTNALYIGFSANGVAATNYFRIPPTGSLTMDVKAIALHLSGTSIAYSVAASLTGIPTSSLTSNWSGSAGVG